jgi:type IV pilus assembly protein PilO
MGMSLKDDFAKWPWFAQLLVFVGIAIVIIVLVYFFSIKDMKRSIIAYNSEWSKLQIDIAKGRENKQRTEQFKQELQRIEAQLNFLKKILPEKEELADLYTKIQERASHFGLKVIMFKPAPKPNDKQYYVEYPIDITLNSDYHGLAKFFEDIGKLQRIVNVNDISLQGKTFKDKPEYTLEGKIVAATYTYKETEEK